MNEIVLPELPPVTIALLSWWDEGHSQWPWRESRDPYAIWVAEVMLQQTQVVTVLPYYSRWMERFPTVQSLAEASQDEVLKCWEGLGYYRRARNLHAAAELITRCSGGRLPETVEGLMELPGIGRYTAGAIASIAFNQPVPAVDGNVIRILTRLNDIAGDVSRAKTIRHLWNLASELLPADRPGDFNQAFMELGQNICLPASPICHKCPLSFSCMAGKKGNQTERPVRPKKRALPHYQVTAGVIVQEDGRFLIAKRPIDGLLGGLWEFPGGKQEDGESLEDTLRREIKEELDIDIWVDHKLLVVKHAYTHFRITLHAFMARYQAGKPQNLGVDDHAWVELTDLGDYPFAMADRKIIEHLYSTIIQEDDGDPPSTDRSDASGSTLGKWPK